MAFEKTVSVSMLASIIRGVDGSTIATAYVETVPDMRKRGNPFWDRTTQAATIFKRSAITIVIGGTYRGAMDRAHLRAWNSGPAPAAFEPQRRSWGTKMTGTGNATPRRRRASIVTHKGVPYFDVQRVRVLSVSYVDRAGNEVPLAAVNRWLKTRKRREVDWRDYRLSNVRQLRMQGNVFNVRRDIVAEQAARAA